MTRNSGEQPDSGQLRSDEPALEAWLVAPGLAEHAPLFARERIGLDVLGDLTDADLRALGVAAWGDRRRILNAAAALRASAGHPGRDCEPSLTRTAERTHTEWEGRNWPGPAAVGWALGGGVKPKRSGGATAEASGPVEDAIPDK